MSQLLDRWMSDVLRHQVAPIAFDNYRSVADLHIRPVLGRKRLTKLVPADVDALMSAKLDVGYSVSTVRRIRAVLVQALNQAERWDIIGRNVAAFTRGPRGTRKEGRTLTLEQARQLLDSLHGHRLEALYVTMLGLGLRRGEALGLSWSDVDLKRGVLVIMRALKREGGAIVLGDLKTAKSRRSLNVPKPVLESLNAHRVRQDHDRSAVGAHGRSPDWSSRRRSARPSSLATSIEISSASANGQASAAGTPTNSGTPPLRSCWRRECQSRWSRTFSGIRQSG